MSNFAPNFTDFGDFFGNSVLPFLRPLLLSILIWTVGRRVIRAVTMYVRGLLEKQKVDLTAARYLSSVLGIGMTVALVLTIANLFGIETTGYAGLLAGAGLAIGAAVGGQLANFASGILMQILRPFRAGDVIRGGGAEGVVREIGLLNTTINNLENVRVIIGNAKIFGDNITNFTHNPHRTHTIKLDIRASHDHMRVMRLLESIGAKVPGVIASPAPACVIAEVRPSGAALALTVACNHADFNSVSAELNRMVYESFKAEGIIN
jgi:small conductance mechanosensitive channel